MKTIGLQNFRKFQILPMMDLGGVNLFVGTNNSGKSTAIKGMALLLDNILNWEKDTEYSTPFTKGFQFITRSGTHLYLGGYQSSINSASGEEPMSFSFIEKDTRISIALQNVGDKLEEPQFYVPLSHLEIENLVTNIIFRFQFDAENEDNLIIEVPIDGLRTFIKNKMIGARKSGISNQSGKKSDRKLASAAITAGLFGGAGLTIKSVYDAMRGVFEVDYGSLAAELEQLSKITDDKLIIRSKLHNSNADSHKNNEEALIDKKIKKYGESCYSYIRASFWKIKQDVGGLPIYHYIETHNATHTNTVNIENKEDFLSQTLSLYYRENVDKDSQAVDFINFWLRELNIAQGFDIRNLYGEIFIAYLFDDKKDAKPLGTYGTGSIQLFILLMHIAIAIHSGKPILMMIEEPEQNLHPALQGKLADLFYKIWKESGGRVRFVVETHSEYLVRRMQVIVASTIKQGEQDIDSMNRDLKVYYFSDKMLPYSMNFKNNGRFENKFGQGFFDESSRMNYDLVLLEKED